MARKTFTFKKVVPLIAFFVVFSVGSAARAATIMNGKEVTPYVQRRQGVDKFFVNRCPTGPLVTSFRLLPSPSGLKAIGYLQ